MTFSPKQFAADLYGDGFKALSVIAPLVSIGASVMKASGIAFQGVSYAWAFAPLLIWALVAYFRRHAYSKRLEQQISDARVELARLRDAGVKLRNSAQDGFDTDQEFEEWKALASAWNDQVVAEIRKINEADAIWFSVLDVVPEPRLGWSAGYIDNEDQAHFYAMHDCRVARLGESIIRLKSPA